MTREQIRALVEEHAKGATEAVDPCRVYDAKGTYIYFSADACELDMCRTCADKLLTTRGLETDQIEVFDGGEESDSIHTCGGCGVPLLDTLTQYGAEEELCHWESHGMPSSADEWSEFLRMVNAIEDALFHRVDALFAGWRR